MDWYYANIINPLISLSGSLYASMQPMINHNNRAIAAAETYRLPAAYRNVLFFKAGILDTFTVTAYHRSQALLFKTPLCGKAKKTAGGGFYD